MPTKSASNIKWFSDEYLKSQFEAVLQKYWVLCILGPFLRVFWLHPLPPLRHTLPTAPKDSPSGTEFLIQFWIYNFKLFWSSIFLRIFRIKSSGRPGVRKTQNQHFFRFSWSNFYEIAMLLHFGMLYMMLGNFFFMRFGSITGSWNLFFKESFGNNLGHFSVTVGLHPPNYDDHRPYNK